MAVVTAAVVGIAAAGASTAMSFSAAAKEKRAMEEADAAAKKALQEAKDRATTDYYEGLNVPLDAYSAEFENNLAVAQQQTEALQEGDSRALAAGVGRVGAVAGENAEGTRIAMGEQISDLQATKAQSKDAINQQLIEMDVAAARDANQRRNESEARRSAHLQQGVQGIGATVSAVGSAAPLFGKAKGAADAAGKAANTVSGVTAPKLTRTPMSMNMFGNQDSPFASKGLSLSNPSTGTKLNTGFTPSFGSPNYNPFALNNTQLFGSDRRLKTDINLIGKSDSGLNIYSFKYKDQEGLYQGVMADEMNPEVVVRSGKYDMVNYAMIDVEFKEI
jgi:hypothetical protein